MHCPACGAAIQNGWGFCRQCGAAQTHTATRSDILDLVPDAEDRCATAVEGGAVNEVSHASDPTVPLPVAVPEVSPRSLAAGTGSGREVEHSSHTEAGIAELLLGHDTRALGEPAGAPASQARPARRWPIWVLAGALALSIAAAGTLGWQLDTSNQQVHTRNQQLASTRASLASTSSDLETRTGELASARTQVSDQATQITGLTTKNTSITTQLKEIQTQLQGTRNTVGRQSKEIGRQSTEIGYLNTCLKGVMSALNYVAYNDYYGAAAELEGVTSVCRKAQAGL